MGSNWGLAAVVLLSLLASHNRAQSTPPPSTGFTSVTAPPAASPPPAPPTQIVSGGCTPSSLVIPGGCFYTIGASGSIGFEIHYSLDLDAQAITIGMRGTTGVGNAPGTAGYLSISFQSGGNHLMYYADSVIAWMDAGAPWIEAYPIYNLNVLQSQSGMNQPTLTNTSVTLENNVLTAIFTRPLANPASGVNINPEEVAFNAAWSAHNAELILHDGYVGLSADLLTGGAATIAKDPRDKYWVAHGVLGTLAWALFVPHAVAFAIFKAKWSRFLGVDAMWFHLHRLFVFIAVVLTVIAIAIARAKFGQYTHDSKLDAHADICWVMVALIGLQMVFAIGFRPTKDAATRLYWNWTHFTVGRVLLLLGIADIGIGIYLYKRKQAPEKLMTEGGWVGLLVACFATALIHVLVMAVLPAPPAKVEKTEKEGLETGVPEATNGAANGKNGKEEHADVADVAVDMTKNKIYRDDSAVGAMTEDLADVQISMPRNVVFGEPGTLPLPNATDDSARVPK